MKRNIPTRNNGISMFYCKTGLTISVKGDK